MTSREQSSEKSRFNISAKEFNPDDIINDHTNRPLPHYRGPAPVLYTGPAPPPPHHWGPPPPAPHYWGPPPPPPHYWGPPPPPHYWGPPPPPPHFRGTVVHPPHLKVEVLEDGSHDADDLKIVPVDQNESTVAKAIKEDEELPVVQKESADKKEKCKCINCSKCLYRFNYDVPSNYSAEEKLLWKKISPPKELERISPYLCEGEPAEMALIREAMINHKFKLNKFQISDDEYYITSEKTKETSPDMISFQLHYHKYHIIPYKFTINGDNIMHKTYVYDPKTYKIILKIHITTHLKGPRKIYKMAYDYDNKKKTLEVSEYDTHCIIHKEEVTGECWFENDFKYR